MDQEMMEILHENHKKTKRENSILDENKKLKRYNDILEVATAISVWSLLVIMLIEIFG